MVKIIIIGGVAGGATAAARARRIDEHAQIILFERSDYISFANCGLPYYIGQIIQERGDLLVTTPEDFMARYNIDIRIQTEVTAIDRKNKRITARSRNGEAYEESYDRLILSPGAEPVRPPIQGIENENIFTLRSIPDADCIKALIDTKRLKSAVIVGGGFIGLEMVENIIHQNVKVTIVEMQDQVMPALDFEMAAFIHDHLKERGVDFVLGDGVDRFEETDKCLYVRTTKGKSIECDMVILTIGIKPENKLAIESGLDIGTKGGIRVDGTMQTSDPDIFAVGDAVETTDFITGMPTMCALAGPANKQGRIAADNALGRKSIFRGTLGTSIVRIFELVVACTGASEKTLTQNNIPFQISYTHSGSHASYYPGASMMAIKLIFSPGSGKLLGAQIVGSHGVDKRIDVIATAIRGSMTVYDLEELELAYAPPYSSAKDPVNIAGYVSANMLKCDVKIAHWNEFYDFRSNEHVIIDLRNSDELEEDGSIEDTLHIPLNELRQQLSALSHDKTYVLFCAINQRAYIGYRIFVQHGFQAVVLSGGYQTYLGFKDRIMRE